MSRRERDFIQSFIAITAIFILAVAVIVAWIEKIIKENQEKIHYFGYIVLGIVFFLAAAIVVFCLILKKRKEKTRQIYLDNDNLLRFSFKSMSGDDFEKFVADVYYKLGYQAEQVGGSGDGGVDVRAKKDNKIYLIQCKDWNSNKANPDDVSRLHSAVIRESADYGIFVAVSGFTTQARAEFEKEPKIELIDGQGIIDLYEKANQS